VGFLDSWFRIGQPKDAFRAARNNQLPPSAVLPLLEHVAQSAAIRTGHFQNSEFANFRGAPFPVFPQNPNASRLRGCEGVLLRAPADRTKIIRVFYRFLLGRFTRAGMAWLRSFRYQNINSAAGRVGRQASG